MISPIHSFQQLIKELHQAFGRYDYESVYEKIIHLRKKSNESIEYFHDHFIYLGYEFSKDEIDWNFVKQKFKYLVQISLMSPDIESLLSFSIVLGHQALKVPK